MQHGCSKKKMKSRNTLQQQLIFDILSKSQNALSADEVLKELPKKINKTTVYRVLDRFKKNGKVHSITGDNGKAFYALCNTPEDEIHDHEHLHFQCRSCEKIECLPQKVVVPKLENYKVDDTQLLLIGICPKCG